MEPKPRAPAVVNVHPFPSANVCQCFADGQAVLFYLLSGVYVSQGQLVTEFDVLTEHDLCGQVAQ